MKRTYAWALIVGGALFIPGCSSEKPAPTEVSLGILTTCDNSVATVDIDTPVAHNTSGHNGIFRITNNLSQSATGGVTCSGSGTITCTGVSPSTVTLGPGASTNVTATFNAGATPGGFLSVKSCGGSQKGFVSVT